MAIKSFSCMLVSLVLQWPQEVARKRLAGSVVWGLDETLRSCLLEAAAHEHKMPTQSGGIRDSPSVRYRFWLFRKLLWTRYSSFWFALFHLAALFLFREAWCSMLQPPRGIRAT